MLDKHKIQEYIKVIKQQISTSYMNVKGLPNVDPTPSYSIYSNFGFGDLEVTGHHALSIRETLLSYYQNELALYDDLVHTSNVRNIQPYQVSETEVNNSGMIDWFRGEILFTHKPIPVGQVLNLDSDGSVLWEKAKSESVRGSHESSLKISSSTINSDGLATTLLIDGNISKFVQGHNVFGTLDLNTILLRAFNRIVEYYFKDFSRTAFDDLKYIAQAERNISEGYYLVKMLDINFLYDLGTNDAVEQWLYAAELNARTQTGKAHRDKNTVYLQKHSRRWAIKFYNKFKEITSSDRKHRLNREFSETAIPQYIEGKLRSELRLMSLELKELGLTLGSQLTPTVLTDLYNKYMEKIEMKPNVTLVDEELLKLPRHLSNTYQLWKSGSNMKTALPKATFYKHRKLLQEFGVDIAIPPMDKSIPNNVVPMMRIIEAKPVANPQWAYEQGLIAV